MFFAQSLANSNLFVLFFSHIARKRWLKCLWGCRFQSSSLCLCWLSICTHSRSSPPHALIFCGSYRCVPCSLSLNWSLSEKYISSSWIPAWSVSFFCCHSSPGHWRERGDGGAAGLQPPSPSQHPAQRCGCPLPCARTTKRWALLSVMWMCGRYVCFYQQLLGVLHWTGGQQWGCGMPKTAQWDHRGLWWGKMVETKMEVSFYDFRKLFNFTVLLDFILTPNGVEANVPHKS